MKAYLLLLVFCLFYDVQAQLSLASCQSCCDGLNLINQDPDLKADVNAALVALCKDPGCNNAQTCQQTPGSKDRNYCELGEEWRGSNGAPQTIVTTTGITFSLTCAGNGVLGIASKTTKSPTQLPTSSPTKFPTTASPTNNPTKSPTKSPTTSFPTFSPTKSPTKSPTTPFPTVSPTKSPTRSPVTSGPTASPSRSPTKSPTPFPTRVPTTPTIPKTSGGLTSKASISLGVVFGFGGLFAVVGLMVYRRRSSMPKQISEVESDVDTRPGGGSFAEIAKQADAENSPTPVKVDLDIESLVAPSDAILSSGTAVAKKKKKRRTKHPKPAAEGPRTSMGLASLRLSNFWEKKSKPAATNAAVPPTKLESTPIAKILSSTPKVVVSRDAEADIMQLLTASPKTPAAATTVRSTSPSDVSMISESGDGTGTKKKHRKRRTKRTTEVPKEAIDEVLDGADENKKVVDPDFLKKKRDEIAPPDMPRANKKKSQPSALKTLKERLSYNALDKDL